MRTIIFLLFLVPVLATAQKSNAVIRLTDAGGKQINGDAVIKGMERSINVLSANSGGKNNTQFSFTMNVIGASADLKRAMANGEFLTTGQVAFYDPTGKTNGFSYTIKMEKIRVVSCSESMGCNNVMSTSVILQATRIGWTYYQTSPTGAQTVSNKYGYDAETGGSWTNF